MLYVHKNSNSGNLKFFFLLLLLFPFFFFLSSIVTDDVHSTLVTKTCLLNEQTEGYSPNIFSGATDICYAREILIGIETRTPQTPSPSQNTLNPRQASCSKERPADFRTGNRMTEFIQISRGRDKSSVDNACFRVSVDSSCTECYIVKSTERWGNLSTCRALVSGETCSGGGGGTWYPSSRDGSGENQTTSHKAQKVLLHRTKSCEIPGSLYQWSGLGYRPNSVFGVHWMASPRLDEKEHLPYRHNLQGVNWDDLTGSSGNN
jgi:hypothetical protein